MDTAYTFPVAMEAKADNPTGDYRPASKGEIARRALAEYKYYITGVNGANFGLQEGRRATISTKAMILYGRKIKGAQLGGV